MNTRPAAATHILAFLATQDGQPATSELIASSVNTNPSLIRRLLTHLSAAGLTKSQMGSGGGALLARAPTEITLRDVYQAVGGQSVIPLHPEPNPECPVGRNIQAILGRRFEAAESALADSLGKTTIADIAGEVVTREKRSRAKSTRR